jgi:hypothetical protein
MHMCGNRDGATINYAPHLRCRHGGGGGCGGGGGGGRSSPSDRGVVGTPMNITGVAYSG